MDKIHSLNINHLSKEMKLIIALLKETDKELISQSEKLTEGIDWNHFLDLSFHHRVFPIMKTKLKFVDTGANVPSFVLDVLDKEHKKNTFQMLFLTSEMEKISKVFTANHLRLLFLKGPVVAQALYGNVSLRTSHDIDLLVDIHDYSRAKDQMIQMGFAEKDYIKSVLNDWKWRHHHSVFHHQKSGIKVEIHWRLHPGPGSEPDFNELWNRRSQSTLTKQPIYLLGNEDLFYFLTAHGARHGWSRLRWLYDIHQLTKQEVNWSKTRTLLKKYHSAQIGGQALVLSKVIFGSNITAHEQRKLMNNRSMKLARHAIYYLENMINLHDETLPQDVAKYHKRHLFSLMSLHQKTLFTLSFLYPYPEDAELLPLPKQLHLLYFPFRPFLWAWRKTRALP
ncbi:Renal dipeptidase [Salipaludibacillus keqinensis]|uniref:Renal dipeptidase n=1 Tax=Salipaludibacillus keqinensis TaxID=2045207 RepID=A0A323TIK4_9BACI|nr:nucleotidyltransferase family protein [Salipaludibacillus keqinensis]PYZ94648.1 Renal dipeptidase [Salipaludibacillus keqinensis]